MLAATFLCNVFKSTFFPVDLATFLYDVGNRRVTPPKMSALLFLFFLQKTARQCSVTMLHVIVSAPSLPRPSYCWRVYSNYLTSQAREMAR
jgi:hypothetical protein